MRCQGRWTPCAGHACHACHVPKPPRGENAYGMPCSARPATALGSQQGRRDFESGIDRTGKSPPRLPAPESQSRPAGAASSEYAAPAPVLLAFSTRGAPATPPPRRAAREDTMAGGPRILATTAAVAYQRRRLSGPWTGVCEHSPRPASPANNQRTARDSLRGRAPGQDRRPGRGSESSMNARARSDRRRL
jgi:hypothetical protein